MLARFLFSAWELCCVSISPESCAIHVWTFSFLRKSCAVDKSYHHLQCLQPTSHIVALDWDCRLPCSHLLVLLLLTCSCHFCSSPYVFIFTLNFRTLVLLDTCMYVASPPATYCWTSFEVPMATVWRKKMAYQSQKSIANHVILGKSIFIKPTGLRMSWFH